MMRSMKSAVRIFIIQMYTSDLRVILVIAFHEDMQEGKFLFCKIYVNLKMKSLSLGGLDTIRISKTSLHVYKLLLSNMYNLHGWYYVWFMVDIECAITSGAPTRRYGTFDINHLGSKEHGFGWWVNIFLGWDHAYTKADVFVSVWPVRCDNIYNIDPGQHPYFRVR